VRITNPICALGMLCWGVMRTRDVLLGDDDDDDEW